MCSIHVTAQFGKEQEHVSEARTATVIPLSKVAGKHIQLNMSLLIQGEKNKQRIGLYSCLEGTTRSDKEGKK